MRAPQKDYRFETQARKLAGEHKPTDPDRIDAVTFYLSKTTGGAAFERVTSSDYFEQGLSVRDKRKARKTRKQRAKAIRAELVPELQAAKLMNAGPVWLMWLLDPQIWVFLINWISTILDAEEG